MSKNVRELTRWDFARAIPRHQRDRIARGKISVGEEVVALRRFAVMTQMDFANALGISVHALRRWEQGRERPEGSALALLRVAARHPRVLREKRLASGSGSTVGAEYRLSARSGNMAFR